VPPNQALHLTPESCALLLVVTITLTHHQESIATVVCAGKLYRYKLKRKRDNMFCMKCQHALANCTCDDLEERLASLNNSPNFIYKKCRICGKHYARCKCEKPDWTTSHDDKELSDLPTV
jgi:uncharacterized protein with PIN domain